jgi:hypothetical protein
MREQTHWRRESKDPPERSSDRSLIMKIHTTKESVMGQSEPPSTRLASLPRLFRVGRDSRGNWVVQDRQGLCGGLFVNRAEAVKFAMFENGNCPQAVILVPGILELDMSSKPHSRPYPFSTETALQRVA